MIRESESSNDVRNSLATSPAKSLSERLLTVNQSDSTQRKIVNSILPTSGTLFVAETAGWNNNERLESAKLPDDMPSQPSPMLSKTEQAAQSDVPNDTDAFKPTVLVCDDNFDMRSYIKHTLSPNFNVIEACNGRDAFNIAVSLAASEASDSTGSEDGVQTPHRCIDLVLTDIMMPIMDGIELAKALRAHSITRTLPIIMLTARAGTGDSTDGLFAGADDYLYKPFDVQELIARVTTHCNLYRMRLEYADARNKIAVLEAANDAKSKLIALVSHELRTPLQSIIGTVELLREGARCEEERTDLDNIHYSSQVLSSLISDILDVAKIGMQSAGLIIMSLNPVI